MGRHRGSVKPQAGGAAERGRAGRTIPRDRAAVREQALRLGKETADRVGQVASRLPSALPELARQVPDAAANLGSVAHRFAAMVRAGIRKVGLSDFGVSVLLLALLCAVVGSAMSWRELLLIGVGCLAVVVLAVAYTLAHADVTATLSIVKSRLKVTASGEPARTAVTVAITNNSATRTLRPLRVEIPCGADPWSARTASLPPGGTWEGERTVLALRRGIITVGPVSTVRADPLGLFRHEGQVAEPQEIIVHPRTINLDRLGAGLLRDLEGQATRDLASHDLAFHALRPYVAGDERRHIHWRTSARANKLMVRQFVDTRSSHLAILVSGSKAEYLDEDEFETALSVGASITIRASTDNQTVSVIAAGHPAVTAARQRLLDPFSRARWEARRGPRLTDLTQTNARRINGVSVGVLIAGSPVELRQFQQAAVHFGPQVRIIAIRVGASTSGRPPAGDITQLNVARLDDLPRVLRAVS